MVLQIMRKHLGDIAKRNGNAKKNLGWFAEMIRGLFMSIICTVSFSKAKMCQFFFVFSFLFSSVKFPPSHVGLLQIFLLNIMIQLPRFF